MDGSDSDGDIGILNDLLSNVADDAGETIEVPPKRTLQELNFNFLDKTEENTKTDKFDEKCNKSEVHNENLDSSDEEDRRDFQEQNYSEYGRNIKDLLKKDASKSGEHRLFSKDKTSKTFDFNNAIKDNSKVTATASTPKDVYSDPFFGLKIINPLISSAELRMKMTGKAAVTVSRVKYHITSGKSDSDWVIAGVLVSKSPTKTSQKGSAYSIWKLSDLSEEINTVCLFMFSSAYKNFWKTAPGTVIGILNPNVLESKDSTDQATLSVDNPQKVIILGKSKDMGKCKSRKKNGEPCTAIVNLSRCEFCVYHVKQEYNKCSKRAELQSSNSSFGFSGDMLKRRTQKSQAPVNGFSNFTPVYAVKNAKLAAKDAERLALLSGASKVIEKPKVANEGDAKKPKAYSVELTSQQVKKDLDRLNKLRGWKGTVGTISESLNNDASSSSVSQQSNLKNSLGNTNSSPRSSLPIPRLGAGCVGGTIDFSKPITKNHIDRAKINALKWVRENGKIQAQNPNKVLASREQKLENSKKRPREQHEPSEEQETKRSNALSNKFKELLEAKSAHTDLIEKSDKAEEDKYFNKLELKERMEEKMLSTYKVQCKAVTCILCKYTSFSASATCKEQRHPLRVIDAVKRFFKCGDCGSRTVSLDRIPSHSCIKCSSSNWIRAAMMDEKKTNLSTATLSIRGGEEKFIGSTLKDANLNLLVPDNDDK